MLVLDISYHLMLPAQGAGRERLYLAQAAVEQQTAYANKNGLA